MTFVDANEHLHFTNKSRENSVHRYKRKKKLKHPNMMYNVHCIYVYRSKVKKNIQNCINNLTRSHVSLLTSPVIGYPSGMNFGETTSCFVWIN